MPAVHEDPAAPMIATDKELPVTITPRQVTLRDRVTVATLVPFSSADDVPRSLLGYLSDQLNKEIEKGDTYPMTDPIPFSQFGPYWFSNFGAIMLLGDIQSVRETQAMDSAGTDWTKICLGSFNIRPNYPGRSSHICNGMFLVTDAARNRGVGRLMGEGYLEWAPKLVSNVFLCFTFVFVEYRLFITPSGFYADFFSSLLIFNRDTHILFSTSCMKTMLLHAVYGMLWASSESVRCREVVNCAPLLGSLWMLSYTAGI